MPNYIVNEEEEKVLESVGYNKNELVPNPEALNGILKRDYKIRFGEDDELISVNITMRVRSWRKLKFIIDYKTKKGFRGYQSFSSAVWMIIEKTYNGILNGIKRADKEEAEIDPSGPQTLKEAKARIEELEKELAAYEGGKEGEAESRKDNKPLFYDED